MSIRKRSWTTAKGEQKEAWGVDYADTAGKRRLKTFQRKKDADAWWRKAGNEIDEGAHTPDSDSITVEEAAKLPLESCSDLERATVVAYKQHVDLHIVPLIGGTKLPPAQRADGSVIRGPAATGSIRRHAVWDRPLPQIPEIGNWRSETG